MGRGTEDARTRSLEKELEELTILKGIDTFADAFFVDQFWTSTKFSDVCPWIHTGPSTELIDEIYNMVKGGQSEFTTCTDVLQAVAGVYQCMELPVHSTQRLFDAVKTTEGDVELMKRILAKRWVNATKVCDVFPVEDSRGNCKAWTDTENAMFASYVRRFPPAAFNVVCKHLGRASEKKGMRLAFEGYATRMNGRSYVNQEFVF